ncbi:MAG TPA: hypothetical protein VF880_17535 [Actinomycetes bacterium]
MSALQPAAPASHGAPGTTSTRPLPRPPAALAVERLPESSAASTTTTAAASAAIRRLRGGKLAGRGGAPGGCSLTTLPPAARTLANRPVLARG